MDLKKRTNIDSIPTIRQSDLFPRGKAESIYPTKEAPLNECPNSCIDVESNEDSNTCLESRQAEDTGGDAFGHSQERLLLWLPPRSILLLRGESRYKWSHGIPPRKFDLVGGDLRRRETRVSLTFRKVLFPNPGE